ncbi:MAG: hypothetical protein LBK74_11490, partial [Treponema sp.]|nr:hypothetical protein [Treponema sp.]
MYKTLLVVFLSFISLRGYSQTVAFSTEVNPDGTGVTITGFKGDAAEVISYILSSYWISSSRGNTITFSIYGKAHRCKADALPHKKSYPKGTMPHNKILTRTDPSDAGIGGFYGVYHAG